MKLLSWLFGGMLFAILLGAAWAQTSTPPDWEAAFKAAQQQRDAAMKAASDNEVGMALMQKKLQDAEKQSAATAEYWKQFVAGLPAKVASDK